MYIEHLPLQDFLYNEASLYKEKSVKDLIIIDGKNNEVFEITKAYVDCSISKYYIIPGFNATSVDGFTMTENICVAEGVVNLSMEYISANESSQLCAINTRKNFSTFIMLPNNYLQGSDITINCKADYISVNKITPIQLFYFIHISLSFNIY